ncbi:MAG: DUF3524 domain-containing protein [Wenzhouxiangellaceae bacterium]|nr:DUF3524 domain-containing protein [Wenzhouxiangellaceae bacterium]
MSANAWLLSAYRAQSHAAWADWLVSTFDGFDWQRFELPGRHFAWRIRGNPLSWLDTLPDQPPALIVATSMVDLATIKGLHPRLAGVPCVYYFHENQFAYPQSRTQSSVIEAQMVQLYGALAADCIRFNSVYNRDSFLEGVDTLLGRLPDQLPRGVRERLEQKAGVLPVPIVPIPAREPGFERDRRLIVWNHRWDHDKNPDLFADVLIALAEAGVDFRLALLGWRHRHEHPALQRLRRKLPGRILVDECLARTEYRALLARASIVVSTSIHEFQGLALLEAVSAGARPLVPDALCYPEMYPSAYRYPAGNQAALTARLRQWLETGLPPKVDVGGWTAAVLEPRWASLLACSLAGAPSSRL